MGQFGSKRIGGGGRMGYIYIPKEDVASVRTRGYMSMRALHENGIHANTDKYLPQLKAAKAEYADLVRLIELKKCETLEEEVLVYLDWRVQDDYPGLQGSKAIYFLWAPIPTDPHVQEFMADFLKDRVLFEFELPVEAITRPVIVSVTMPKRTDPAYWLDLWRCEMNKRKSSRHQRLWFSGIPHAYFVPNSGLVAPSALRVIKQ